jgi:hypothetical protein
MAWQIPISRKAGRFFRPIFKLYAHCPAPHCDEGKLCAAEF